MAGKVITQAELFGREKAQAIPGRTKAIQDLLLAEGLKAVKLSENCRSMDELRETVFAALHQNSEETRRRYTQLILHWFLKDGVDGLLPNVWRTYKDEAVVNDLLRWTYLVEEPIVGLCVSEMLFPLENGIAIPPTYFDKFLKEYLSAPPPEKTRERIRTNLKRLGFLERNKGKPDRLVPVAPQKTSFLVLLHHLFAQSAIRTVELRTLFANPFWKHLGYKSEDAVRNVLREADSIGVIAKYIVADQIEQVTTCCSLKECLERGMRL